MVTEGAAKAKAIFAIACDSRDYTAEFPLLDATFNGVLAVGGWAPLQIFFVVDVGTREKDLVSTSLLVTFLN